MGKWNRRYLPRKKYRHYDYDDPPSPPKPYNHHGFVFNRVPSWEIDYCNSLKVPWNKVMASKKYIYCYPSVLNWDGSAAEEALQNAKERFLAMINHLPYDYPLPDPDLYIDEIDWNPHIDPELMAELDLPMFDPDKAQKVEKLETIDEGVECVQMQYDENLCTGDNPWERNNTQCAGSTKNNDDNPWERDKMQIDGSLKDGQGWSRWEETVNLNNGNPWEQSFNHPVDSLKNNNWRSGNESWGCSHGFDNTKSSPFVGNQFVNSWNFNEQSTAKGQGGQEWGRGQKGNNSWGWSHGNTNSEGSRNLNNFGYTCKNNYSTGLKEGGWREKTDGSWGGRRTDFQGNEPKYWDSQTFSRGGRSFRGGCRKRESSIQHASKYKSSKYHGDGAYTDGHQY